MKNTVNYKLRHFRRAMCPTAVTYQEVNFVSRKVISTAGFGLREITQHLKQPAYLHRKDHFWGKQPKYHMFNCWFAYSSEPL